MQARFWAAFTPAVVLVVMLIAGFPDTHTANPPCRPARLPRRDPIRDTPSGPFRDLRVLRIDILRAARSETFAVCRIV